MQIKIEIIGTQSEALLTEVLGVLAGVKQKVSGGNAAPIATLFDTEAINKEVERVIETSEKAEETIAKNEGCTVKPIVTFEQLREMIAAKNKTPDRKGKALITKFGFTKLDEVRPRPDVWDQMYAEAKEL